VLQSDDVGWMILRRENKDDVIGCLEFKKSGKDIRSYNKTQVGAVMYGRAQKAFEMWLPKSGHEEGELDMSRTPLHPYLRIYWAIVTGRDALARTLWKESKTPFIASFLGKYVYKHMGARVGVSSSTQKTGFKQKMQEKWDAMATDMLANLDPKGGHLLSGNTVFEEYTFFGISEETGSDFQQLTEQQKLDNRCKRAALEIMSINPQDPQTRIDLAILAENKSIMGHPSTEQFLKKLYVRTCGHETWASSVAQISPKGKLHGHLFGQVAFIGLFTYVYFALDHPDEMEDNLKEHGVRATVTGAESCLWVWIFTLMMTEMQQLINDFDCRIIKYVTASGNQLDAASFLFFLPAFFCRCWGTRGTYVTMTLLFMVNILVWTGRLLSTITIFKSFGIIIIVIKRIMTQNVIPFIAFAAVVIMCFEVAAYFFTWLLEREHKPGEYFNMFSQVADDDLEYASHLGVLWWDRPSYSIMASAMVFKTLFFVMTVVILMNVLIAMMTNTYQQVFASSNEEWRLEHGEKIKEYYEANVLPPPLNTIEGIMNRLMEGRREKESTGAERKKRHSLEERHEWGRHDIFPVSSLAYDMHMATSRYRFQKQRRKEQKSQMMATATQ